MISKDNRPSNAAEQRRRAEEIAREKAAQFPKNLKDLSPEETRHMIHELQVHQIELEMQNEELRISQAELDAARTRYFDIYDLAPVGYCSISEKGLILETNLTAASLLGLDRGALVKHSITQFFHKEDQDIFYLLHKQLIETDAQQSCELRMLKKTGESFWVHLEAIAVQDVNASPVYRVVISDITELKQAEKKIQRDKSRLRRLVDILQHPSETIQEFLDYSLDQAIQLTESKIGYIYHYHEDRKEFVLNTWSKDVMAECAIANPSTRYELDKTGIWGEAVRQRRPIIVNNFQTANPLKKGYPDGHVQLVKFMTVPIFKDDSIVGVVGLANKENNYDESDILQVSLLMEAVWKVTERKQAEEQLQRHEAQYRLVVENINDIIWTFDLSSMTYTFVSPSVQSILGYADEAMVKNLDVVFTPETKQHVVKAFGNFMKGYAEGDILVLDAEHLHKDGSLIWMEISASPSKDDFGNIVGFLGTSRNITERKRAEEMLMASEIKYRRLFEAAKDGILILDAETGMIVDVNPFLVELLGYSSELFLGKTIWDIGFFKDIIKNKDKFLELQEKEYVRYDDLPLETAYGKVIEVEFISNVYDIDHKKVIQCNIRNITERKQAEKEKVKFETRLQQAQKMEAIGSLAGGIAHDLNNILFPITGLSELLLDDIPLDNPAHESIEQIHRSAKRGSEMVKQILAFSRHSNLQKLPIRLQPILKEVFKLSRAAIPMNIGITSHINTDCGMVSADPTQMHQIMMNLITNAYHAVEGIGGTIHITLKETEFEKDLTTFNAMKPGKYACLSVSDTGTGIEQVLIEKIFDPYFTTKEQGKGTGLGLSVVHGIVKEHGGDIRVYSEVGKGTVFHVYLPLLEAAKDSKSVASIRTYPTGCERILLIDDEEPIIRMEQMMLEKLGYQITIRTSSLDALDAFKANPNNFDLVISDRGMPNMTGEQLARELISIKPGIPIILCTGFCDEIDENRSMAMGIKGFLMKPVATGDLAEMVRKVLDEVNGSTS